MPQKGVLTNSVTRKFFGNKRNKGFLLWGTLKKGLRSGLTRKLRFLLSVEDRPYSEENDQGNRRTKKILKANGIIYMKSSVKAFCVTFAKFFYTVCICTD